jgi:hypothetical protein
MYEIDSPKDEASDSEAKSDEAIQQGRRAFAIYLPTSSLLDALLHAIVYS